MDSLISVETLLARLSARKRRLSLLDVRWALAGGPMRDAYVSGHIPGAAFLDLDAELAGPPGAGGRHPLPDADMFAGAMRCAGVSAERPAVVYDAGTSMAAARAWWLLRYFGHPHVAVLDGGLAAWTDAGHKLETGAPVIEQGKFAARPGGMALLDAHHAAELTTRGVLIDARAAGRFRGEVEPVDPIAGHIPGAVNRPTAENVDATGRFRRPGELRAAFKQLGVEDGVAVGVYCGSGVTAAHEVLALELAGYEAALYPGSWSQWITDPSRPVAHGGDDEVQADGCP